MGEEVTNEAQEVPSLSAGSFFKLECIINLVTWTQQCLCHYVFNHNDGMLLHLTEIRVLLTSVWFLDTVMSLVITFYLFCCNDGWLLHIGILSCGGYTLFQVHKNLT